MEEQKPQVAQELLLKVVPCGPENQANEQKAPNV